MLLIAFKKLDARYDEIDFKRKMFIVNCKPSDIKKLNRLNRYGGTISSYCCTGIGPVKIKLKELKRMVINNLWKYRKGNYSV